MDHANYQVGVDSPAGGAYLVTKNDAADLPIFSRCLLVDADGLLKVTMYPNADVVTLPVVKGYNPLRVSRVWSTGSDAIGVHVLY